MQVRVRLCSALSVERAGRTLTGVDLGSRKARTLLAVLGAERGRLVAVDRLADLLWADAPPSDPAANLSTLISRSRRLLGSDVLVGTGGAYGLGTGACVVDLDEAAALLAEGGARGAAGEVALAAASARRALHVLGSGRALPDEGDADWVLAVREEADRLRQGARHLLAGSVATTDPREAVTVAAAAVAVDPYDEHATRHLMRAHVADGSVAAALVAYDGLAVRLRDDLGIDPSADTARLHLAILREEALPGEETLPQHDPRRTTLVGRTSELAQLDRSWAEAGTGAGRLVLVDGEGGIGKTRLLDAVSDLAEATGGLALRARCHPSERSLFLQPFVDALRPVLLRLGDADLADLLREHTTSWVLLVPELAAVVRTTPEPPVAPALERRRAFDAVASLLQRLSRRRPVLLAVDDLQDGGAASVDLLAHLAARLSRERVLLLGAVRSEELATVDRLVDRASRLRLDVLPWTAVEELAGSVGLSAHAAEVMARTAGHSLSVVESLRALAAGDDGVPESLAAAVLARVDRLDEDARELVQGAAVLRGALDPRLLADLVGTGELPTVRSCEELVRVRLWHRVGARYEFANDLTQECVATSLAPALAAAYHRRAADLLSDQPESMATHAHAAGEPARAARGWLLAGRAAMARSAVEDATALFDRALDDAEDASLRARILLARSRAHEASTAYAEALADIEGALALAQEAGDQRLELAALRFLGGDVPVALRRPMGEVRVHLEAGLHLAARLGDRGAEADFTTRLIVLEASRLRLASALVQAESSLVRARSSASEEALPQALDGLKTVLSYLGDADRLEEVVGELVPLLRQRGSTWLLQWAVFESSFVPAAAGEWEATRGLVHDALEVNRRSGFSAYGGYFRAHLGWFERLAGDVDAAVELGRQAVAETSPVDHPWWYAAATGLLAATLVELGETEEAVELSRRGLAAAGPDAPEAWRLRCLAPLAAALGGPAGDAAYEQGRGLLEAVTLPPGRAWVVGADVHLLLARAALRRDQPRAAARAVAPLAVAVADSWGAVRDRVEETLVQIRSATS